MTLAIGPVAFSEALFGPLLADAGQEGAGFVGRLREEWLSGALRFDGENEILLGAVEAGALLGTGGISRDPYAPRPGMGRVRHVYVLRRHRGRGIAGRLMAALLAHARERFDALRLNTRNPDAARLYERFGFVAGDGPNETHRLRL